MSSQTEQIRLLNDHLRQNLSTGLAVITVGVAALGPEAVDRIVKTIAIFDDFCRANDPHQEHDFGAFEAEGETIFFKIDYKLKVVAEQETKKINAAKAEGLAKSSSRRKTS